jgi:hypothetical protein
MWMQTSFPDTEIGAGWTTVRRSIAIDASGAAIITADASHYPSGTAGVVSGEPDKYGVYLRVVPASPDGTP